MRTASSLLLTAFTGAAIGWVHRVARIRNARLDALISALFGSKWQRDDAGHRRSDQQSRHKIDVGAAALQRIPIDSARQRHTQRDQRAEHMPRISTDAVSIHPGNAHPCHHDRNPGTKSYPLAEHEPRQ